MGNTKKQKIIIFVELVVIILFLFFIGSGDVVSPVYGDINVLDEGQYGAWIMHLFSGQHLYKDTYAAYGPLYIYPIYILAKIIPLNVFIIRIVYIVINGFIAVIIAQFLLKKLKIPYYLQLFCIVLLLIIPGYGMRQGMGLLSFLLIYNCVEEDRYLWSFLAGISLAVTFLTSSDIGIFSTIATIFYLSYKAIGVENINKYLKKMSILVLSYMLIFTIFFIWSEYEGWFYSYISTILSDLRIYSSIDIAIGKNFPNALTLIPQSLSPIKWIKFIFSQEMFLYWLYLFYIVTFIYFFITILFKKFTKEDNLIFIVALFGLMLSTILVGRTDHLGFTLAPAFILFVYFLQKLIPQIKKVKVIDKIFYLFFIIFILVFSIRLISIYRPHIRNIVLIPHAIANRQNAIKLVGPIAISDSQTKSIITLQTFIKTHTTHRDGVYIFSNDPMYYFLINKNNPTKYDLPEVANVKDKRMDVLNDLQTKKPKYIIYDVTSYAVDGVSNYSRLPEVATFINKYYKKEKLNNFIIYQRITLQKATF